MNKNAFLTVMIAAVLIWALYTWVTKLAEIVNTTRVNMEHFDF